jgi:ribosomal protein S30
MSESLTRAGVARQYRKRTPHCKKKKEKERLKFIRNKLVIIREPKYNKTH